MTIEEIAARIETPDRSFWSKAQERLDRLTKPQGSLGRLEELAARYVMLTGKTKPTVPRAAVFTFAADHGIAKDGVSAYPQEVTAQMVLNFLRGGAGVNVLAQHAGAEVRVVDIGVAGEFPVLPRLIQRKVAAGTKNFLREPAMTKEQARHAVETGIVLAMEAVRDGIGILGTGDMGIGNTTASAAIAAVLTGEPAASVTGRGTGIDDDMMRHKIAVIEQALARHRPDHNDALDVLAKIGGFEIAGIAGLILGGAAARVPIVLDGFISGAAALVAVGLAPACRDYLIASHRSVECGHDAVLARLDLMPLLDLQLRLGEGTGACLGISLLKAAIKIYGQMATFDEAGVSGAEARAGQC